MRSLPAGAELGEGSIVSTPEQCIRFQCVGWTKRACPRVNRHAGKDTRGRGAKSRLCPPYASSENGKSRVETEKRGCAFYPPGETSVECECVMKDELTTILDAMRAAQAELADYLVSADRNAELTIAKLVGILDRRDVVRAMRLLRASERPGGALQRTLAEAS